MKKQHYITVTGTMGSGKTTVAKLLADSLDWQLIEENFGQNEFLSRFYADMPRWAFHSQTFFLMEKITQMMETAKLLVHTSIVQDTPIQQDAFSYAKALHVLGNMDSAERKLYKKIYSSFDPYLPKPTLIVYLKTSIPVVSARISKRGRSFEKKVAVSYLQLLEELNERWLQKESSDRVITIPTDNINVINNAEDRQLVINAVKKRLRI